MVVSPAVAPTVAAHNTDAYPPDLLTVRRGQAFELTAAGPALTITPVSAGPATRGDPTGDPLEVSVEEGASDWTLAPVAESETTYTLSVPVTASIGLYTLDDGSGDAPVELVVVFNPFLAEDPVYLADARERAEYVLAESGLIWRGSAESNYPAAWDFAQFDKKVLLTSLWLLDGLDFESRADAVSVTRHLSAAVNVNDDGGVLVGRWDGAYDDGTPPSQWTGSGSVLHAFYESGAPVRYGQCWVFAGVLTSVCRALGIACRVTTNFASAHDTTQPFNRAVDLFYDAEGELIEHRSADSIWNFHVWCDAWMKRPDLDAAGEEFGIDMNGWQAIDATPQELSEGVFQCGPSPLNAIKNGYAVDYDTDFVIGEVNADILYYWQNAAVEDGEEPEFTVRNKRTRNVGKFTSTKAVGSNRRNDVTLLYKHPEGSEEERKAHANREKPSDEVVPEPDQPHDLVFTQAYKSRVRFGDEVQLLLKAKNNGSVPATVHFTSVARAIRYTGAPTSRIDKKTEDVTVAPGRTASVAIKLTEKEYTTHLVRDVQTIKFYNSAKVASSGETWADECIVRVYGDDALEVSAPWNVVIGQEDRAFATVGVTNRFRVPLTNVVVKAEGRGLVAQPVTVNLGTVEPGANKVATVPIEGSVAGARTLVVTLDTDELQDIIKSVNVTVYDRSRMNLFDWIAVGFRSLFS